MLASCRCETVRKVIEIVVEEVAVDVQSGARLVVPKHALHGQHGGSSANSDARGGVAQLVRRQTRHSRVTGSTVEPRAPHVPHPEHISIRRWEQEVCGVPTDDERVDLIVQEPRPWDGASLVILRVRPDELSVHLRHWLDTATGGEQLLSLAEKHGANLVILDSVSRFVQGAENEASTWNALYAHSLAPLKAAGIASLRVDHTGKHEERGMRGSSAKASDVDSAWSLAYDAGSGKRTLTRTHSRDGMGPGEVRLRVLHEPLEHIVVDSEAINASLLAEQLRRLGFDANGTREQARALLEPYGFPLPNAEYGKVKKMLSEDDAHGQ